MSRPGDDRRRKPARRPSGPAQIREAVSRIVESLPTDAPFEAARSARRLLKRKEAKRVIQSALERHFEKEELKPYQAELIKLLQHIEATGRKIITAAAPWYVIRSDDKHLARRETIKLILKLNPYRGRSRTLDFGLDRRIVVPGDKELKNMKKEFKKHGRFLG